MAEPMSQLTFIPAGAPDPLSRRTTYYYEAHELPAFKALPGTRTTYYYEANARVSCIVPLGTRTTYVYNPPTVATSRETTDPNRTPNTGVCDEVDTMVADIHHEPCIEELLPDLPSAIQFLPEPESPDRENP